MRKTVVLLLGLVLVLTVVAVGQEEKKAPEMPPWFDMENCAFCKHLGAQEGLMDHMKWEYHDISNGLLAITTVHPDHKAAYQKAMKAMEEVGKELETGKRTMAETPMCGFCMAYGELMNAGVKFDYVQGASADITLVTSDDPETLKKIKDFGERTRTELAAWKGEGEEKAEEKTEEATE